MRVHHLNCGAMQPYGGALFDGQTPILAPAELSCHCLLLETDAAGLVLVDTGTVSQDARDAAERHSPFFRAIDRIRLNPAEAAANQVRRLGHRPSDVAHIVMTHLDFDHAAGLVDFPGARVHLSAAEAEAARHPPNPKNRARYRSAQFADSEPRWRTYRAFPETWFGLPAVPVEGVPGVMLVSLPGHTPGHCGVAVQDGGGGGGRTGSRWLLHAADAIFNHRELDPVSPSMPTGARAYQWFMQTSQVQRRRSLRQLRWIAHDHADEVEVICTHDPSLLAGLSE